MHDTVLSSLELDGLATDLAFKLGHFGHRLVELALTVGLLGLPSDGYLFYSLNLSLLQPGLELLLLSSLPQLHLPYSLILVIGIDILLTSLGFHFLRPLHFTHILEVDNAAS